MTRDELQKFFQQHILNRLKGKSDELMGGYSEDIEKILAICGSMSTSKLDLLDQLNDFWRIYAGSVIDNKEKTPKEIYDHVCDGMSPATGAALRLTIHRLEERIGLLDFESMVDLLEMFAAAYYLGLYEFFSRCETSPYWLARDVALKTECGEPRGQAHKKLKREIDNLTAPFFEWLEKQFANGSTRQHYVEVERGLSLPQFKRLRELTEVPKDRTYPPFSKKKHLYPKAWAIKCKYRKRK